MSRSPYLLALVLALAAPLRAQQRSTDTFVLMKQGREAGRERITLERGSTGGSRVQFESELLTGRSVAAVVNRLADKLPDALQLEFRDSTGTEVVRAGQRGNRIIVTTSGPSGRRTRELAAETRTLLLDEQPRALLYLVADLATPAGQPLTAMYVRSGRRVSFTATRRDMGSRGSAVDLQGGITAYLLLDATGRLERLEIPGDGIVLSPLPR